MQWWLRNGADLTWVRLNCQVQMVFGLVKIPPDNKLCVSIQWILECLLFADIVLGIALVSFAVYAIWMAWTVEICIYMLPGVMYMFTIQNQYKYTYKYLYWSWKYVFISLSSLKCYISFEEDLYISSHAQYILKKFRKPKRKKLYSAYGIFGQGGFFVI